jgi:hypothetical protein
MCLEIVRYRRRKRDRDLQEELLVRQQHLLSSQKAAQQANNRRVTIPASLTRFPSPSSRHGCAPDLSCRGASPCRRAFIGDAPHCPRPAPGAPGTPAQAAPGPVKVFTPDSSSSGGPSPSPPPQPPPQPQPHATTAEVAGKGAGPDPATLPYGHGQGQVAPSSPRPASLPPCSPRHWTSLVPSLALCRNTSP